MLEIALMNHYFAKCPTVMPAIVVLLGFAGCAGSSADTLQMAVHSYNDSMRWKRFPHAAGFLQPKERAEFLERYLSAEDDLHIQSLEVRGVHFDESEQLPTAVVTVVAESYLLPSTVVAKTVITQRWQNHGGDWILMESSKHLAPELDPEQATGQK